MSSAICARIAVLSMAAVTLMGCATRTFDLQGHRGARGLAPENTLPAFAAALAIGVTTLELDVAVTRDDVIVVSHDAVLNPDITRRSDGTYLSEKGPSIRSLAYADLARYDVGRIKPDSRYAKTFAQQQAVDGTRIPRLAEVFALARRAGNHDIRYNIETKLSPLSPTDTLPPETFAERLVAVLYASGVTRQATIQSFDWRTLRHVQQISPEIETVYLSAQQTFLDNIGAAKPEGSAWTAGIQARDHGGSVARMVKAAGGRNWSPYFKDVDQAKLAEARALGLRVVVWTVNQPEDIEKMLDLGVDGIISDRPDLVRAAMSTRKMALPRATPISP